MIPRRSRRTLFLLTYLVLQAAAQQAQTKAQSPSSSSAAPVKPAATNSALDPGAVTNNVYRNKTLALSCKIPAGWVLRTDEWNAREGKKEEEKEEGKNEETKNQETNNAEKKDVQPAPASSTDARVLLAAFSRPPEARAEDINASIVIAAESAASYPGLTEAAQYFFPLTEVAKAQGFAADEDPYEIAIGTKTVVRGDFHKDVGSRVMHQSTLALLSHGYAISITVIGGTDDEVEDLIDGLSFTPTAK
jgi:hypothetical protein